MERDFPMHLTMWKLVETSTERAFNHSEVSLRASVLNTENETKNVCQISIP